MASNHDPECFDHAIDLVRLIRERHGDYFCVAVGGYPETHLEYVTAALALVAAVALAIYCAALALDLVGVLLHCCNVTRHGGFW